MNGMLKDDDSFLDLFINLTKEGSKMPLRLMKSSINFFFFEYTVEWMRMKMGKYA